MNTLSILEIGKILDRLPCGVPFALQKHPGRLFLAGGFIRAVLNDEPPSDVDLFVTDDAAADASAGFLVSKTGSQILVTENATTLTGVSPAVQIVTRRKFEDAQSLIDSFDFSICRAAIWFNETWQSVVDPRFEEDLMDKKLRYVGSGAGANDTLLRVLKFTSRGYVIDNLSFATIITETVSGMGKHALGCTQKTLTEALLKSFRGEPAAPVRSGNYF